MKTEIVTDFKAATFQAKRMFNADLPLVWRAWTEAELLDQWWAPKPWRCETKSIDFRPKGKWFYEMVGPTGERHGGMQVYDEIIPEDYFSGTDAFADGEGNINEDLPVASWRNTFIPTESGTLVESFAKYPNTEALETVLKMGMSEGLSMAHDNLDAVLTVMTKKTL